MKVRPATRADLDAIAAVERAAMPGGGWSRAQIAEELDRELGRAWVAEEEGRVLGHALGQHVVGETEVLELAVHPDARRQGLGRALLRALAPPGTEAYLEVRASNASAIALYLSEGFAKTGVRRGYYQDGEDALLMARKP